MGEVSITIVDLLIAAVILISAAYAAWRGLLRETLSIFSWAVAAYLTLLLFPSFRPMLREYISPDWLADIGVFIGIFMIVLVPLSYLSHRFSDAVRGTEIGPIDRALGLVFGVARGLVIVGLAHIIFSVLVPPANHPAWLIEARFFPVVENTSDVLLSFVPPPDDVSAVDIGLTTTAPPPPKTAQNPPQTAQNPPPEPSTQGYGAEERAALDRLIETTGAP